MCSQSKRTRSSLQQTARNEQVAARKRETGTVGTHDFFRQAQQVGFRLEEFNQVTQTCLSVTGGVGQVREGQQHVQELETKDQDKQKEKNLKDTRTKPCLRRRPRGKGARALTAGVGACPLLAQARLRRPDAAQRQTRWTVSVHCEPMSATTRCRNGGKSATYTSRNPYELSSTWATRNINNAVFIWSSQAKPQSLIWWRGASPCGELLAPSLMHALLTKGKRKKLKNDPEQLVANIMGTFAPARISLPCHSRRQNRRE